MLTQLHLLKIFRLLRKLGWNQRYLTLKICQATLIPIGPIASYLGAVCWFPLPLALHLREVTLISLSIFVTCSYIPPGSDLIVYEHHLSAIKSVLSLLSNSDLLIVLGDFNLPNISWSPPTDSRVAIPLSVHDFVDGLLELSLQQVSFIRNSLNRLLDLVFVSDPSIVTVSRIDALVVAEDQYHPTMELTIGLPCVDTVSHLVSQTKVRCFRKCDYKKLNDMIF